MALLYYMSQLLDRRLGNSGLGVIAAVVLFLSISGTVTQLNSGSQVSETSTPTTVVHTTTSTTAASTTTSTASTELASTTTAVARNGLDGYAAVNFSVASGSDSLGKGFCGLLAASPSQQATGLMNMTNLGGYDGMIFPFSSDTSAAFYMANVPVALSVAWFDKDGKFVSSADMEPCKTEAAKCQLYRPAGPYRTAVEVLKGNLGNLGIGAGSSLTIGSSGPC